MVSFFSSLFSSIFFLIKTFVIVVGILGLIVLICKIIQLIDKRREKKSKLHDASLKVLNKVEKVCKNDSKECLKSLDNFDKKEVKKDE